MSDDPMPARGCVESIKISLRRPVEISTLNRAKRSLLSTGAVQAQRAQI